MNRYIRFLTICLVGLIGCSGGQGDGRSAKTLPGLKVVATTGQVGDLLHRVGGDRLQVDVLMGPGIDPHLYTASAGDVERLRGADAIFYNGLHLEAKLGDVIERLGDRRPVLAVAEAIPETRLLSPEAFAGAHDPHVWFDVELWSGCVDAVADLLAELDPDGAVGYRDRAGVYRAELSALHDYAVARFASIPAERRVLVTAHDAFNYLGRAYGLDVRGLQGISTATEAGTGDVQQLAELIATRRIPAIFVESSVSPRAIDAVRRAVRARGFEVIVGGEIFSDALGDPGTPEGTYIGMIRHNVEVIASALSGEGIHDAN